MQIKVSREHEELKICLWTQNLQKPFTVKFLKLVPKFRSLFIKKWCEKY